MTRAPKPTKPIVGATPSAADADGAEIIQIKVWLFGISPMMWRRVLVSSTCTLGELHGVIQVAMGWEGIHLYQFCLRTARYGSLELSASSPEVTLAALRLRKSARFTYEYDLKTPWRHEVGIENQLKPGTSKAYPVCTGGVGACSPEDCDGPAGFMAGRNGALSLDALEDLDTMTEIIGQVVLERRTELLRDEDTRWRLEEAVERSRVPPPAPCPAARPNLCLIMQSVFCLAARRTKLTGRVPMFGAAPVSKKRIGLNRAPEPVMGIVWRSLLIGTAANWCGGCTQMRDPMVWGGARMRWRSIDRAHNAVFENNKAGSDGECRMRQKRGAAMVGVALQDRMNGWRRNRSRSPGNQAGVAA